MVDGMTQIGQWRWSLLSFSLFPKGEFLGNHIFYRFLFVPTTTYAFIVVVESF